MCFKLGFRVSLGFLLETLGCFGRFLFIFGDGNLGMGIRGWEFGRIWFLELLGLLREKIGRDCENGVNRERRVEEKRKVGDSI